MMMQPRKVATYGKSSRKPITDFSAFAQASEPSQDSLHQGYPTSRAASTQDGGLRVVHSSASPRQFHKARNVVSELQGRKGPTSGRTQSKDEMYDLPSTDEDTEQNTSASDTRSRKRRRLMSQDDVLLTSVVFDDASLQRHIAAEVRRESEVVASIAADAAESSKVARAYVRKRSDVVKRNKPSAIKNNTPATIESSDLNATLSTNIIESKTPNAKKAMQTKFHGHSAAIPSLSPRRTPGHKRNGTQPRRYSYTPPRDDSLLGLAASGRPELKVSQEEQSFPPSTPPRPSSSAGLATTPKQRELWEKLLSNDKQQPSLKDLDLPGLYITDQKGPTRTHNMYSTIHTVDRDVSAKPGKRSAKLVDFLKTSDGDRGASEREDSEDLESSGAERSKSIRSDVSINDEILTMQTSPSTGSHNKRLQFQDPGLAPGPQPTPLLQGVPKVTYIRERTHLGDNDLNNAAMLDVPFVAERELPRNLPRGASSVKQCPSDPIMDISNELGEVEDSQGGPMRSIHELREAGGNTRLVGELESMLDDLDERIGSSISARRTSLMNLASKLLDASTCRMFTDQGLEPRLLAQLNFGHDIIERSLLAASILQILFNTTSAVFHSQINQLKTTNLLIGLLGHTEDLPRQSKLRETNMSKVAQSEYTTFCISFLRSSVWRTLKPPMLTGQILALHCLDLLVRQAREGGCLAEILSADAISSIAETSLSFPGTLQPEKSCSRICLELAVSILESSSISGTAENRDPEWTDLTLKRISGISQFLGENPSHDYGNLKTLTLRLYLNLTNASPHLCETLSKPYLVDAIFRTMFLQFDQLSKPENQHQDSRLLDHLVLSLGCLINLAESSDTMRRMVIDLNTEQHTFLETLLQLFVKKRRKAAEVRVSSLLFWAFC